MSIKLGANSTIAVRSVVSSAGTPITSTNPQERAIKDVLIAAFEAIPSQASATATVAAIVTALKTLP